jgi:hypothetical protein
MAEMAWQDAPQALQGPQPPVAQKKVEFQTDLQDAFRQAPQSIAQLVSMMADGSV